MRPNSLKVNFCDGNNYYHLKIHKILKSDQELDDQAVTEIQQMYSHYFRHNDNHTHVHIAELKIHAVIMIIVKFHCKLTHHQGQITNDIKYFISS